MILIGWVGVFFGLLVGPPQLVKILKTRNIDGISVWTYTFLCLALLFYLIYAIYIQDLVFMVAQSVNLVINSIILVLLLKRQWT